MLRKIANSEQASRRLTSLIDQIGLAIANFAALVLFARWLQVYEFGILATSLAIWYFFESIQRSGIILPMISAIPMPQTEPQANGAWFMLNVFIAVGACFSLLLLGGVLHFFSAELATILYGSVFVVPACLMFFFLRRFLYHLEKYKYALVTMGSFVSTYFIALAFTWAFHDKMTVWTAFLIVTLPHFLCSLFMYVLVKDFISPQRGISSFISAHIRSIFEMGSGGLAAYFSNNGIQLLLGFLAGPVQAGIFAAIRIITRPFFIMITALNDTEHSKAAKVYAQNNTAGLYKFIFNVGLYLFVLFAPFLVLVFIYAPDILHFVLNEKYNNYTLEARLWILALIPFIVNLPMDILLSTLGRTRFLMTVKIISALISLSIIVMAFLYGHLTVQMGIISVLLGRLYLMLHCFAFFIVVKKSK